MVARIMTANPIVQIRRAGNAKILPASRIAIVKEGCSRYSCPMEYGDAAAPMRADPAVAARENVVLVKHVAAAHVAKTACK